MSRRIVALSTSDNPYNPLEDFANWFAWDTQQGYHTASYLARIARTSSELSSADNDLEQERAIDEILFFNVTGNYIKVEKIIEGAEDS